MGRRKIEIKAIKDDRNRSVTFLKRKGGLFKKAHELSVLCSVDVAVIIFGHNKKLYEFSSGDINETLGRYQYYGGAHEHKGPADFMGKRDGDDEDDDDDNVGSQHGDSHSPPEQCNVPYGLTNHPTYQHMRQHTASASPPMPNGSLSFQPRQGTPQPLGGSRPGSRNAFRRTSSNLAPQHAHPSTQGPPGQNSYAYVPNPPIYSGPPTAPMQMSRPGPPPNQPHHPYTHPPSQQGPVYQAFMQDQRRQSMPPTFPQHQQHPQQHPQQQQERPSQVHQPSPPQPEPNHFHSPPLPQQQQQQQQQQQPKPLSQAAKSHSIFTPIDDSRSLLAQHWGNTSTAETSSKPEPVTKSETGPRSQSIDVASVQRGQINGTHVSAPQQRVPPAPIGPPQRTASISSMPSFGPPSRTNSMPDAKRPRLKVQIPSETSDGGEGTADSSPKESTTGQTPAKGNGEQGHGGVVLPPPSPSASALLSAGAQGPPNPFARPAPPMNNYTTSNGKDIETPISALPSRFVADGLLPSPSSFYPPEWGFGRGDSNILPSPLNFQTPVATNGPSFRDEEGDRKRKTSEGSDNGVVKRHKS